MYAVTPAPVLVYVYVPLSGRLRWPLVRVGPRPVLLGLLGLWLAVKLVFVHEVAARRDPGREPRAKGEQLAVLALQLFERIARDGREELALGAHAVREREGR